MKLSQSLLDYNITELNWSLEFFFAMSEMITLSLFMPTDLLDYLLAALVLSPVMKSLQSPGLYDNFCTDCPSYGPQWGGVPLSHGHKLRMRAWTDEEALAHKCIASISVYFFYKAYYEETQ